MILRAGMQRIARRVFAVKEWLIEGVASEPLEIGALVVVKYEWQVTSVGGSSALDGVVVLAHRAIKLAATVDKHFISNLK